MVNLNVYLNNVAKDVYNEKGVKVFSKDEGNAGYDLLSLEEYDLMPGERRLFKLGIYTDFDNHYHVEMRPRSGLALKHGISLVNTPGTIDASYRGEWGAIIINHSDKAYKISRGDKICQVVFIKHEEIGIMLNVEELGDLSTTNRGSGGFNSSGY